LVLDDEYRRWLSHWVHSELHKISNQSSANPTCTPTWRQTEPPSPFRLSPPLFTLATDLVSVSDRVIGKTKKWGRLSLIVEVVVLLTDIKRYVTMD